MTIYYTIYKTTNLINGTIYIGKHKTSNPFDDYLGSGKLISRSIKKYGEHNFKKEILYIYDNPEDCIYMEKVLVGYEQVDDPNYYNMKLGGDGGWDHINDGINNKNVLCVIDLNTGSTQQVTKETFNSNSNLKGVKYGKKHSAHTKKILSSKKINTVFIKDEFGIKKRISKKEFDNNKDKYVGVTKGLVLCRNKEGIIKQVSKEGEQYINKEFVGITSKMVFCKTEEGEEIWIRYKEFKNRENSLKLICFDPNNR